jgi:hypothetical protein
MMQVHDIVRTRPNPFVGRGKVGTIIAITPGNMWPYIVKFANKKTMSFADSELELVSHQL